MDYFIDSTNHLLAELERIDLLIRVQVARARQFYSQDEQFRGLYISEEELNALLVQPAGRPRWLPQANGDAAQPNPSLQALKHQIAQKKQSSAERGIELRLDALQRIFRLSDLECDMVLICLAIELDLRYERFYAYLQDDVTKKKPGIELTLNLLCDSVPEKLTGLISFYQDSPLLKHDLISIVAEPAQPEQPLMAQSLKLSDRVVHYLIGSNAIDERLCAFASVSKPGRRNSVGVHRIDRDVLSKLDNLLKSDWGGKSVLICLINADDQRKRCIAEILSNGRGLSLLVVNLERLIASVGSTDSEKEFRLILREALLQRAAIFWSDFDSALDPANREFLNCFVRHGEHFPGVSFLSSRIGWLPPGELRAMSYLQVELPGLTSGERRRIWSDALGPDIASDGQDDIPALASKFKLTGGQIQDAAATAKSLALWDDANNGRIGRKHLYEACRRHSNQKLSSLARKIPSKYTWNDIVLPPDRNEQLREICNHVKYRDRVLHEWGFARKLAMGKGLSVLFAGPSGTGKTMAADIIAGELGLDLYKIDLSTVVSKYIGETEKNLSRIFAEAETSNAILFFDEADALFGKRSEVKDARDRYANIETGYLLQRMEEHEGVVILASNFRKNMDEAFVRRLHFTVEFPFPGEEDRRRIWEGVWPEAVPRDPDLDLGFLAGRFQVTGGNIRNIALSAAFLAADEGGLVEMAHIVRATQREYQKMGKIVSEVDFGA
ncbi:MAG: ATP-binding protein [Gammaproteobacteria bacterium]